MREIKNNPDLCLDSIQKFGWARSCLLVNPMQEKVCIEISYALIREMIRKNPSLKKEPIVKVAETYGMKILVHYGLTEDEWLLSTLGSGLLYSKGDNSFSPSKNSNAHTPKEKGDSSSN